MLCVAWLLLLNCLIRNIRTFYPHKLWLRIVYRVAHVAAKCGKINAKCGGQGTGYLDVECELRSASFRVRASECEAVEYELRSAKTKSARYIYNETRSREHLK
ncbi:hypothetical protein BX600DRAFT_51041 [Xylariales sp. PMI_506]|nr:hypothetical protein BX600DRAFT_51041 [Xylariales sp. PMI_506]